MTKLLSIEIIKSDNSKLSLEIKKISDKRYKEIINNDDDPISAEIIKDPKVIQFYKDHDIDLPDNLIFDPSYDNDQIILIDEINTRWMLD